MEYLVNRTTNTVAFDRDFLTTDVDLSSLDPLLDIVIFDSETGTGLKFFGTAAIVDGYLRPQETIDYDEFRQLVGSIIDEAQLRWDAHRYPYVIYKTTVDENEARDGMYVGNIRYEREYPHPTRVPEGYTLIESPNPFEPDPLVQWTGSGWFRAPFKYNDDIIIQQKSFVGFIQKQVSALINNQLRNYTLYDIIEHGKSIEPSDYGRHGYPTMADYIHDLNESVRVQLDLIRSARNVNDLLAVKFDVDEIYS
jgi:hypothetical protein